MSNITIPLAYYQDYYCLPGSWWISGPPRNGWGGSASYTSTIFDPGHWQDDSQGFSVSFDEATGIATIQLPAGWRDVTGNWSGTYFKGPAHGTDPYHPYAYFTGSIIDPVILDPLIGPVSLPCG